MALTRRTPLRARTRLRSGSKGGLKRGKALPKQNEARRRRKRAGYDAYMRSPAWKAVRRAVLERDGHRCTLADANCRGVLTVDHTSYAYFGRELEGMHTVRTLCEYHHAIKDGWKRQGRTKTSERM